MKVRKGNIKTLTPHVGYKERLRHTKTTARRGRA